MQHIAHGYLLFSVLQSSFLEALLHHKLRRTLKTGKISLTNRLKTTTHMLKYAQACTCTHKISLGVGEKKDRISASAIISPKLYHSISLVSARHKP